MSPIEQNPLFGKLWESLKKYLSERKLDELHLKEVAKKKGINSKIKELIKLILEEKYPSIYPHPYGAWGFEGILTFQGRSGGICQQR